MKKTLLYTAVMGVFLLTSCSGSDDSGTPPPPPPPMDVTYTNTIQSIIASNCSGCHGNPPTNGAPVSLITYSQVVDAVNNRKLIDRINGVSGVAQMPPAALLSSSLRQTIQDWVSDRMPEN